MEIRDADIRERADDLFPPAMTIAYGHDCPPSEIKMAQETHSWDKKLKKLRKETRERLSRAKKGNTDELLKLFDASRDTYKKAISEVKGKRWASFCSNIKTGAEAARLFKLMACIPGAMLSILLLPGGIF